SSTAAVTVKLVLAVIEPDVALMLVPPVATLLANPAVVMVATAGVAELHCTLAVMSWVVPLLNVPVALNCSVMPTAIEGTAGVIAIDTSAAGVTSRVVEPVTAPELALTDVLPTATLL